MYFDETFLGWGVDDLEWSYRICKSGIPIVLSESVRAIHLPHSRDPDANRKTETLNYRRFLLKWPSPDVELCHAFGDVQANSLYLDFMEDRKRVMANFKGTLGVVRGYIDGKHALIIGVELDEMNQILDTKIAGLFDSHSFRFIYPLIGMALPFNEKEIEDCRILNSISNFSNKYALAILKETNRVSQHLTLPAGPLEDLALKELG